MRSRMRNSLNSCVATSTRKLCGGAVSSLRVGSAPSARCPFCAALGGGGSGFSKGMLARGSGSVGPLRCDMRHSPFANYTNDKDSEDQEKESTREGHHDCRDVETGCKLSLPRGVIVRLRRGCTIAATVVVKGECRMSHLNGATDPD